MTSTQRLQAVLKGEPVDRIPVAGWAHVMNLCDRHADDFVKATINYQNAHGFDFVKVTEHPQYMAEAMGAVLRPTSNWEETAFWCVEKMLVNTPEDWKKLRVPDLHTSSLAREIEVVDRLCDHFRDDVPVIPSVFSPVMWAMYFSVAAAEQHRREKEEGLIPPWAAYLAENEALVKQGLEVLTEANNRFIEGVARVGAAGIFFANPFAQSAWPKEQYDTFAKPYDMENLRLASEKMWFNIFHWCGRQNLQYNYIESYPVQALNWEDTCETNPTMAQIREKTDKVFIGGIDRLYDLEGGSREEIKERIKNRAREAVRQAGPRLIFAGGCTFHASSEQRFFVIQEAVDEVTAELRQ